MNKKSPLERAGFFYRYQCLEKSVDVPVNFLDDGAQIFLFVDKVDIIYIDDQ
jgi:hypothetical protein